MRILSARWLPVKLAVCLVAFPCLALGGDEKAETEFKNLAARMEEAGAGRERLRQDLLAFRRAYPGTAQALQAADLLRQLPSPLDKLDARAIPAVERFDWQPKELVAILGEHRGRNGQAVTCVAYSPNGKLVACGGYSYGVRLWEASTLRLNHVLGAGGVVYALAFSRDGKMLAAGESNGAARVYDMTATPPKLLGATKGSTSALYAVALAADGKTLAAGGYDTFVRLWHLTPPSAANKGEQEFKEEPALAGHVGAVQGLAFAPDGKTLASCGADGTIRLWDIASSPPKEKVQVKEHTGAVSCIAYAPGGRTLASGGADATIRLWNLDYARPKEYALLKSPSAVNALAFAPGGQMLATGGADYVARLWHVGSGTKKERAALEGHQAAVTGVAFSPDGRGLVSGSGDWTVRLWVVGQKSAERHPPQGHLSAAYTAAFAPDGKTLAGGSQDATVRVWDLTGTAARQRSLLKEAYPVYAVGYSADSKLLAVGGASAVLGVWNVDNKRILHRLEGHKSAIGSLDYSLDGSRVLTGTADKTARLWDPKEGKELQTLQGHESYVNSVAISPDGRRALTGGGYYLLDQNGAIVYKDGKPVYADCTVRLWDLEDGKELHRFKARSGIVDAVAFSPDGKFAFSSANDYTLLKYDLTGAKPGDPQIFYKSTTGQPSLLAIAPDGRALATRGPDASITLWDAANGKKLREWNLNENFSRVAFSSDSRYLAVPLHTGVVYVLRLSSVK